VKLVSIGPAGSEHPGVLVGERRYVPLGPFLDRFNLPSTMLAVVGILDRVRPEIEAYAGSATPVEIAEGVRFGAPVPRPRNVYAVGANTYSHVLEASRMTNGKTAKTPFLIPLVPSSICGPNDPLIRPFETDEFDYEVELAAVIGTYAFRVAPGRGLDHVLGYMASNDVTARDVQAGKGEETDFYWQHSRSKSSNTFTPTGPYLVTRDEVEDFSAITLQSFVNGEVRQDSTTKDLVASVSEIVESFSASVPLYPGDVILTGSPEGIGGLMEPTGYMQPGDTLRTVVGGIGTMEAVVVAEADLGADLARGGA
jgi:2,4-didehydro-3-deoxy-L-rhamnonate hydrolase